MQNILDRPLAVSEQKWNGSGHSLTRYDSAKPT